MTNDPLDASDSRYQRAARLLGQKLGIDWRDLSAEQVNDYLRKIEIARRAPTPDSPDNSPTDAPD